MNLAFSAILKESTKNNRKKKKLARGNQFGMNKLDRGFKLSFFSLSPQIASYAGLDDRGTNPGSVRVGTPTDHSGTLPVMWLKA